MTPSYAAGVGAGWLERGGIEGSGLGSGLGLGLARARRYRGYLMVIERLNNGYLTRAWRSQLGLGLGLTRAWRSQLGLGLEVTRA